MRIACVMITERRAPIAPIAFASFFAQQRTRGFEAHLIVCCPSSEVFAYTETEASCANGFWPRAGFLSCFGSVPNDLHAACRTLFDYELVWRIQKEPFDVVTIWDDDDYSPPDRLDRIASCHDLLAGRPVVAGYSDGYFVNLRTLQGERMDLKQRWADHPQSWPIWGATLTFNQLAFEAVGGFASRPMPGYDREFNEGVRDVGGQLVVFDPPEDRLPVAFSHGKNVVTCLHVPGEPMEDKLCTWMPDSVFAEVKAAQQFLIDHRTFPPWS